MNSYRKVALYVICLFVSLFLSAFDSYNLLFRPTGHIKEVETAQCSYCGLQLLCNCVSLEVYCFSVVLQVNFARLLDS